MDKKGREERERGRKEKSKEKEEERETLQGQLEECQKICKVGNLIHF